LNAVGAAVRMLSGFDFVPQDTKFIAVMGGQTLAALAQPFLLSSPTKLAALWFGADERATANMIASLSESLGNFLKTNLFLRNINFFVNGHPDQKGRHVKFFSLNTVITLCL